MRSPRWMVDRFDDIKVIRYEVPGFDELPLEEKELVYYLAEAAKCGRDIFFDQNCAVNLPVRRQNRQPLRDAKRFVLRGRFLGPSVLLSGAQKGNFAL